MKLLVFLQLLTVFTLSAQVVTFEEELYVSKDDILTEYERIEYFNKFIILGSFFETRIQLNRLQLQGEFYLYGVKDQRSNFIFQSEKSESLFNSLYSENLYSLSWIAFKRKFRSQMDVKMNPTPFVEMLGLSSLREPRIQDSLISPDPKLYVHFVGLNVSDYSDSKFGPKAIHPLRFDSEGFFAFYDQDMQKISEYTNLPEAGMNLTLSTSGMTAYYFPEPRNLEVYQEGYMQAFSTAKDFRFNQYNLVTKERLQRDLFSDRTLDEINLSDTIYPRGLYNLKENIFLLIYTKGGDFNYRTGTLNGMIFHKNGSLIGMLPGVFQGNGETNDAASGYGSEINPGAYHWSPDLSVRYSIHDGQIWKSKTNIDITPFIPLLNEEVATNRATEVMYSLIDNPTILEVIPPGSSVTISDYYYGPRASHPEDNVLYLQVLGPRGLLGWIDARTADVDYDEYVAKILEIEG
jgi:hypothetical protein